MRRFLTDSPRVSIAIAVIGVSLVSAGLAGLDAGATRGAARRPPIKGAPADFNGDGFGDLAIGVPGDDLGGHPDAGGVNVIYGSANGLTALGNQFWSQDSPGIPGSSATGDQFGFAVATGDLNGDGFSDLAIGIPSKDPPVEDAGAVLVLYGSAQGLTANGRQEWTQDSPGIAGNETRADGFGRSLAIGDFNGDGFADLAVGVPFDSGGKPHTGAVNVIYGSPAGLTASGNQLWSEGVAGMQGTPAPGAMFGFSVAAGDFNGDGFADLGIGVPGQSPPLASGAVSVVYGSAGGLAAVGNQLWTQNSPGIADVSEPNDFLGYSLTVGDFNGDVFADLAIGVPFEDVGAVIDAGGVDVIYGSVKGLTAAGSQFWSQAGPIADYPKRSDEFGFSLAAGDFNGDGKVDLAVGVPGDKVSGQLDAGAVNVLYGSAKGLTATGNQWWNQDIPKILGVATVGDRLGFAVTSADFGNGSRADLAIGVPGGNVARKKDSGGLNVIYGSPSGLSAAGNQFLSQNTQGIIEVAEPGDQFGYSVGR